MNTRLFLSIVIPAYNEAMRIGPSLEKVARFLWDKPFQSEVIVVDDGSTDDTALLVRQFIEEHNKAEIVVRLVPNGANYGKGYSIRHGVLEAHGDVVLISDADLSAPISEAPKLYEPIKSSQAEVVFGSRGLDPTMVKLAQSPFRQFAGRLFNLCVRVLTGLNFKDTQCGFKAFVRELTVPIFRVQRISGFGFDPEILYLAKKRGLRLLEVPVLWYHSEGTKVRMLRDSIRMFVNLIEIRVNDLLGRYDEIKR